MLHAWSEIPGLIPESEIIQVIKDKCCHLNSEEESRKEKYKAITVVESESGASDAE